MKHTLLNKIALTGLLALLLNVPGLSHAGTSTYNSTLTDPLPIGPYDWREPGGMIAIDSINVMDDIMIKDIKVTLDFDHEAAGDIIIDLAGPDGKRLTLIEEIFSPHELDEFAQGEMYSFSDQGMPINPPPNKLVDGRIVIAGGEYQPQTSIFTDYVSFAEWQGTSGKGLWTLEIYDVIDAPGDEPWIFGGNLYSWKLDITDQQQPPQVPIPGAIWLLGSAVAASIGFRNKKS